LRILNLKCRIENHTHTLRKKDKEGWE